MNALYESTIPSCGVLGVGPLPAPPPPAAYLISCNGEGEGERLLSVSQARGLFQATTANTTIDVTGDMATGFAWRNPGAVPRGSFTVRPLTVCELARRATPAADMAARTPPAEPTQHGPLPTSAPIRTSSS